ncbi:MAG: acyl-CoA dehydrogenase [Alphaproteobacteria bacterium]|nr:MAG: acyl-CoA dehydrogenase [Alphaproteobacteria bacterium]
MDGMHGLIGEEQAMFAEAVRRFGEREYGDGSAPHRLGFDRARLRRLGELGCLALAVPEERGGIGGPVEAMAALAALAPFMVPEPLIASGVHAASLIAVAAGEAAAARLLPGIAAGETVAVVADLEDGARYDRGHVRATARRTARGYLLDGFKPMVPFGAEADLIIASARLDGDVALFVVWPGGGVERTPSPRIDGLPAADITFLSCSVAEEDRLDAAPAIEALERAADVATAAQTAEMVGLMDALNAATMEYTRTRRQFGVPVASFQALQHRIADMWIACEETRSMAAAAALACGAGDATRSRTVSAAMLIACDAAQRVANEAIQMHGGIGTTDELIVSHWYRRLAALRQELGDRRSHLARLAAVA